jgi:hypothetical protein
MLFLFDIDGTLLRGMPPLHRMALCDAAERIYNVSLSPDDLGQTAGMTDSFSARSPNMGSRRLVLKRDYQLSGARPLPLTGSGWSSRISLPTILPMLGARWNGSGMREQSSDW